MDGPYVKESKKFSNPFVQIRREIHTISIEVHIEINRYTEIEKYCTVHFPKLSLSTKLTRHRRAR